MHLIRNRAYEFGVRGIDPAKLTLAEEMYCKQNSGEKRCGRQVA